MNLGTLKETEVDFVVVFGVTKSGLVGCLDEGEEELPEEMHRVRWSVPSTWLAFHEEEDDDIDPELPPLRAGERVKLEGVNEPVLFELTGKVLEVERRKPWLWGARVRVKKLMRFVGTP